MSFAAEDARSIQEMFGKVARRYDLANAILSLGIDRLWRSRLCRMASLDRPARILDLATGSGVLALELQKTAPEALVVAADFSGPMLLQAARKGVENLVLADALELPFPEHTFDLVTVAFGLRNMASYSDALAEMHRVLKPGGQVLVMDFSMPPRLFGRIYRIYLRFILPKIAGLLTGCGPAYRYLGDSVERFPSGERMLDLMRAAGFRDPGSAPLSGGIVTIYHAGRG